MPPIPKQAEIPADGNWHDLPDRPVVSIELSTVLGEIDIQPDGTGRVCIRYPGAPLFTVEYTVDAASGDEPELPL